MGTGAAMDLVTAVTAHDGVMRARATPQRIVAIAANQQLIVAATGGDHIAAMAAID